MIMMANNYHYHQNYYWPKNSSLFIIDFCSIFTLINRLWWWWRRCWYCPTTTTMIKQIFIPLINLFIIYDHHHYRYRFRSFITNKINNTTSKSVYHHLSSNANVLFPLLFLTTIFSLFIPIAKCEEECLRSKVWCYECESINDPYCSDPFNVSFDMSLMRMCEGCCVKIVVEKNTPQKNIWRTCTSRLQINLFMVDHVCMEESGGQGHMCFCEIHHHRQSIIIIFIIIIILAIQNNQRIIISIISTIIILFILNELITSILFTSSVSVSLSFLLAINWLPSSSSMSLWTTKFPLKFLHLSLFIIMMILLMIIPLIFYRS
ncbi:hypothetical protein DERP_006509 [Dermatophagoides pteronyssinus]|uniref:Protein quiver n=1 Tax=Dermatophagoides pteronyssinus TaxID=6956 RepID=A0ABQ8IQP3_DERPT|nr:hypothetical protein DERP_006509 [Dermatophagoides pteronyssinus]